MFVIMCSNENDDSLMASLIQTLTQMQIKFSVQITASLCLSKITILTVMVQPHCDISQKVFLWPVTGESVANCDFHRNWKVKSCGYGKSSNLVDFDAIGWNEVWMGILFCLLDFNGGININTQNCLWISKTWPGQPGSVSTTSIKNGSWVYLWPDFTGCILIWHIIWWTYFGDVLVIVAKW